MKSVFRILKARLPRIGKVKIKNKHFEVELDHSLCEMIRSLFLELETHKILFTPCNIPCIKCDSKNGCIASVRRIEHDIVDLRKKIRKNEYAQIPLSRIQQACSNFQTFLLSRKTNYPYVDNSLARTCDVVNLRFEIFAAIGILSRAYKLPVAPVFDYMIRLFSHEIDEKMEFKESRLLNVN